MSSFVTAPENIFIPDPEKFQFILNSILCDGVDSLHVITDFDRTLSSAGPVGIKDDTFSSHGVVEHCPHVSQKYRDTCIALFNKYYPIEVSHELSIEQKIPSMVEWYTLAHNALLKEKISRLDMKSAVLSSRICLRAGAKEFIEKIQNMKIPLLIFSAGIATVIELLLKDKEKVQIDDNSVHIIGNWLLFDENDVHSGFSEPLIHMFNKNESQTKGHQYSKQVQNRKNVLLLGDGTGDIHMADGMTHENTLKIGFLNAEIEKLLPVYSKIYDVIILNNEPGFDWILHNILHKF